jgi:hypothetical protein
LSYKLSQEIKTFIASLLGKTQVERQAAIKTEVSSLKQWAKDNNIPQQYLQFGGLGMSRKSFGLEKGDRMVNKPFNQK